MTTALEWKVPAEVSTRKSESSVMEVIFVPSMVRTPLCPRTRVRAC